MASSSSTGVPMLTTTNYADWKPQIEDYLRSKGTLIYVNRSEPDPMNTKAWDKWAGARDMAVGDIRRHISPELRNAPEAAGDDPRAILTALEGRFGVSTFAARFNALQACLNVRQSGDETASAFVARARESLRVLQSTRSRSYTLADADEEMLISILLNGTSLTGITTPPPYPVQANCSDSGGGSDPRGHPQAWSCCCSGAR